MSGVLIIEGGGGGGGVEGVIIYCSSYIFPSHKNHEQGGC